MPATRLRLSPVALLLGLGALACGPRDARLVRIEIAGVVVNEGGAPLGGVTLRPNPQGGAVRSGGDVFSNGAGQYTLSMTVTEDADHATFRATAPGRAPQTVWVAMQPGVVKYGMRLSLQPLQSATLTAGMPTTVATTINGRAASIRVGTVPPGAVLRYAQLPVPTLLAAGADVGTALQAVTPSIYLAVTDANGTPVASPPEMTVTLDPGGAPAIAGATPLEALTLNEEGLWEASRPLGGSGNAQTFTAQHGQVTLVARRFPAACAVGRVEALSGPCPGGYVAAQGNEGVFSMTSVNAAGDYCVTGVAGSSVNIFTAAVNRVVTLRPTIGSCANPGDCQRTDPFFLTPDQCQASTGTGP